MFTRVISKIIYSHHVLFRFFIKKQVLIKINDINYFVGLSLKNVFDCPSNTFFRVQYPRTKSGILS